MHADVFYREQHCHSASQATIRGGPLASYSSCIPCGGARNSRGQKRRSCVSPKQCQDNPAIVGREAETDTPCGGARYEPVFLASYSCPGFATCSTNGALSSAGLCSHRDLTTAIWKAEIVNHPKVQRRAIRVRISAFPISAFCFVCSAGADGKDMAEMAGALLQSPAR